MMILRLGVMFADVGIADVVFGDGIVDGKDWVTARFTACS
jgi:hypothetical protein